MGVVAGAQDQQLELCQATIDGRHSDDYDLGKRMFQPSGSSRSLGTTTTKGFH
jgi:hypothetical protein